MIAQKDYSQDTNLIIDCPVLLTERLVMRPPHMDDLSDLISCANDRRVAEMLAHMPYPYSETDGRDFIENFAEKTRDIATYVLTMAESGAFLGCASLTPKDEQLSIGYWIGAAHWGKGYATEAALAITDLAFRATNIEVLNASCRAINGGSRNVIKKCGFQFVGDGMMDSAAAGPVPIENYQLDRKSWVDLRSWPGKGN